VFHSAGSADSDGDVGGELELDSKRSGDDGIVGASVDQEGDFKSGDFNID